MSQPLQSRTCTIREPLLEASTRWPRTTPRPVLQASRSRFSGIREPFLQAPASCTRATSGSAFAGAAAPASCDPVTVVAGSASWPPYAVPTIFRDRTWPDCRSEVIHAAGSSPENGDRPTLAMSITRRDGLVRGRQSTARGICIPMRARRRHTRRTEGASSLPRSGRTRA